MARTQRVVLDGGASWTVVGANGLPVDPAEQYLAFLRAQGRSPNTVKAYARGLAQWWCLLEETATAWDWIGASLFGQFLVYLRTGDLPGIDRIGAAPQVLAPTSVASRSASVLAFYTYMAAAEKVTQPYEVLYGSGSVQRRGRSTYRGLLTGIAQDVRPRPLYRVRAVAKERTPVLTPPQVRMILDGCAVEDGAGGWRPNLAGVRDRLLFAVLAETGMRLGEALSVRHCDIHVSGGDTPWIEVASRQDHPHGLRSKSDRQRRIYVGDDLAALYSAYTWELVEAGIDVDITDVANHFVFVNVGAQPLFAPMRVESVYARVRSLTRHQPELQVGWSPHWLRHTHATALLLSGQPPHVVMRRLGHLDIQTTLGLYGWVTADAEMKTVANWTSYVDGWRGVHDAS